MKCRKQRLQCLRLIRVHSIQLIVLSSDQLSFRFVQSFRAVSAHGHVLPKLLYLRVRCCDEAQPLWPPQGPGPFLFSSDGSPLLWSEWPSQHVVEVRPSSVIELEDDMGDSVSGEEQPRPPRGSGVQDHHPPYLLLPSAGCLVICDVDPAISKFDIYDELSVGKKGPDASSFGLSQSLS